MYVFWGRKISESFIYYCLCPTCILLGFKPLCDLSEPEMKGFSAWMGTILLCFTGYVVSKGRVLETGSYQPGLWLQVTENHL